MLSFHGLDMGGPAGCWDQSRRGLELRQGGTGEGGAGVILGIRRMEN